VFLTVIIGLDDQSRLLKLSLRALVLDLVNEPGVEDTYFLWYLRSGSDLKYALFQEASDFNLTGILVQFVVLQEYRNIRGLARASSATLWWNSRNSRRNHACIAFGLAVGFGNRFRFGVIGNNLNIPYVKGLYGG
jgi:hypothetical protein